MVRRQGAILGSDDPAAVGFTTVGRIELFGDTPTMAWSPDGKHLAIASVQEDAGDDGYGYGGYGYGYGYGTTPSNMFSDKLGVHVVEASSGRVTAKFLMEQAYHPVWLTHDELAWAGGSSIYTAKLTDQQPTVKDVDFDVHNLQSAGRGKLLYYQAGTGAGWFTWDLKTDPTRVGEPADVSAPGPSWVPPAQILKSQCTQSSGKLSVARDPERIALYVGGKAASEISPERPLSYTHWACTPNDEHCGVLAGCLSPRGDQLAFLTEGQVGFWLNIVPIKLETVQSLARPTATPTPRPKPQDAKLRADKTGDQLATVINIVLNGNTPSLAWSPDSKRVAANSGRSADYVTYQTQRQPEETDGIYVLTVGTGESQRVHSRVGYHPVWVGNERLVWVVDSYVVGAQRAGVYSAELNKDNIVGRRIMAASYAYNTQPVDDERVAVWVYDWDNQAGTYENGWTYLNPSTRGLESALKLGGETSWDVPDTLRDKQCLQEVGSVRVTTSETEVRLTVGAKKVIVSTNPFLYRHDMCSWDESNKKHCGPVRACLSPDGSHLAYISAGEPGEYGVKVVKVPR